MNAPQIVQKLWSYCDVLRDDGLPYVCRLFWWMA